MQQLKNSFKEVLSSVLPMTILIFVVTQIVAPMDADLMISFVCGAIMMMLGMTLFLFGAEISMFEVGNRIGSFLVKKQSLWVLILVGFLVGVFVTIAEPDLQVLAGQIDDVSGGEVSKTLLMAIVGVGVGVFLVIALLRILFRGKILPVLFVGYALIFILSFFAAPEYIPVAFDSGGVTTGPLTVPFILALGSGITSAVRRGKEGDDAFGIVGLASLGPVLAVMLLGVIYA